MKEKYNPKPKKISLPQKIKTQHTDERTKTTPSFFHKMSQSETFASSCRKWKTDPYGRDVNVEPRDRPDSRDHTITNASLYERLANTETFASSKMKGVNPCKEQKSSEHAANAGYQSDPSESGSSVASPREVTNAQFFNRMAQTETFASSILKGQYKPDTIAEIRNYSPRKTTPSFFVRMAQTETVSSSFMKGKVNPNDQGGRNDGPTKKTDSAFFERMAKQETVSSSFKKGKIDPQKRPPSNKSSKKTTLSFFEKMAQTETFSSSIMKGKIEPKCHDVRDNATIRKTDASFFERIAARETISSAQKRLSNPRKV